MEPQGNIGLHLVCHGERTTAEVATQDKKDRHTRVPMRSSRTTRAVRGTPGGMVQTTHGKKETGRGRGDARMEDETLAQPATK